MEPLTASSAAPYIPPTPPMAALCWMAPLVGDAKVLGDFLSPFVYHNVGGQGGEPKHPGGNLELGG